MNRPSRRDLMLGNRTGLAVTTGAAALSTLVWATQHTISWFVPVLAWLLCKASFAARRRVTVWRNWSGAWDAMAGADAANRPLQTQSPRRPAPAKASASLPAQQEPPPQRKRLRIPRALLIAGWLVLFACLKAHQGEASTPALGVGALCFFLLTAWGALAVCIDAGRWLLRPASASRARLTKPDATSPVLATREGATDADGNHIVAQCLPVPRDALPSGHVREILPPYCRELLARAPGKQVSGEQ